jgi:hypothetical protein
MLAYQHAIDLLPRLGYIGQDAITRREALAHARGIACRAASHALKRADINTAVELLEHGRGIFWNQLLQLRVPKNAAPAKLMARMEHLVQALQSAEDGDWAQRRSQAEELEAMITEIRSTPGYEYFMVPRPFSDLLGNVHTIDGVIVLLVPSDSFCDVILIGGSDARKDHLRLTALNMDRLDNLCKLLRSGVQQERNACSGIRGMKKAEATSQNVLQELWITLVKPVIERLGLRVSVYKSLLITQLTVGVEKSGPITTATDMVSNRVTDVLAAARCWHI